MASKARKQTARGRKQDRARVAGGQDYETRYEAKKTRKSAGAVKKAVKKVGSSRKRSRCGWGVDIIAIARTPATASPNLLALGSVRCCPHSHSDAPPHFEVSRQMEVGQP
jgi:hypothetical protein